MYGGWCGVCVVVLVCGVCGSVVLWFCDGVCLWLCVCACVLVCLCACVLVCVWCVCLCVNGLTIEAIPPVFQTCTLQNHKITKNFFERGTLPKFYIVQELFLFC